MIYRLITINCTKDNLLREKVTSYEHGAVTFEFTVMNGKEQIDLTECKQAVYYGTKPDGHIIGNACDIADDKVMLPLSLQMTTCAGLLKGIVELQFDTGNIRFFGVNFEVFPAPETADIESTDEFTLLEQKIAEVQKLIDEGFESTQGKSAYDIAVDNGFEGTEAEWLESLKGEPGESYNLTATDKTNIANEVLALLADGDEVSY